MTAALEFSNSTRMGKHKALASLCFPNKNGRGAKENQRKPKEGEPYNEANEEEKPSDEKHTSFEGGEELTEESPNSSEESTIQSSFDIDEEHYKSTPDLSSSKKRRSDDSLDDHVYKRLKQDTKSDSCIGNDLFSAKICLKKQEKSDSSGKRRHGEECRSFEGIKLTEESPDSLEESTTRSSSDVDEEHYKFTPDLSTSKRRSDDSSVDHVHKRLKQDMKSDSSIGKDLFSAKFSLKKQEKSNSSGKRNRSEVDGDCNAAKKKSRGSIDNTQLKNLGPLKLPIFDGLVADRVFDPDTQKLKSQLFEINEKLKSKAVNDGTRLSEQRQQIISSLIQKSPYFKAPSDYKPAKLFKKLYIPIKQYPSYNFIGLIIGPRGRTLKRMEKRTGARILVRGRGSLKIRKALNHKDRKVDYLENDDFHVYIEAGTQKSLDTAVGMVEKLLVPIEENTNEHKRDQLRSSENGHKIISKRLSATVDKGAENSVLTHWPIKQCYASFTKSNGFVSHIDSVNANSPSNFGPLTQTPAPSSVFWHADPFNGNSSLYFGSLFKTPIPLPMISDYANNPSSQNHLCQRACFSSRCPLQPLRSLHAPFSF